MTYIRLRVLIIFFKAVPQHTLDIGAFTLYKRRARDNDDIAVFGQKVIAGMHRGADYTADPVSCGGIAQFFRHGDAEASLVHTVFSPVHRHERCMKRFSLMVRPAKVNVFLHTVYFHAKQPLAYKK